jgi:hypothetical protein
MKNGFLMMNEIPKIESTKLKLNDKRKGVIEEKDEDENEEDEDYSSGKRCRMRSLTNREDKRTIDSILLERIQLSPVNSYIFNEHRESESITESKESKR